MLFDQIASNKRRTWILLIAFFILLALIGAAVGYLWLGSSLGGVILALIIGGIYAFSMVFQSTEVVMRMNGAREVTEAVSYTHLVTTKQRKNTWTTFTAFQVWKTSGSRLTKKVSKPSRRCSFATKRKSFTLV